MHRWYFNKTSYTHQADYDLKHDSVRKVSWYKYYYYLHHYYIVIYFYNKEIPFFFCYSTRKKKSKHILTWFYFSTDTALDNVR